MDIGDINPTMSRDDSDGIFKQPTAKQACETCRARKTKCDEGRPRCAVCRRLNVACAYREPKPTKQDKTLVHILDSVRALAAKFDRFEYRWEAFLAPNKTQQHPVGTNVRQQSIGDAAVHIGESPLPNPDDSGLAVMNWDFSTTSLQSPSSVLYNDRIDSRKLLAWPAIQALLRDDLAQIPAWDGASEGGEKWLARISRACESSLPTDVPLDFKLIGGSPSIVWGSGPVPLAKTIIEDLCEAFFQSFHTMYPILDRRHFYSDTLPEAYSSSFDQNDDCATLVLLVLALGAVAKEGIFGNPILEESTGRSTGIRGGTAERPPGLAYWNEANRRLGRAITTFDLNMLQCFLLLSLYYSQCSRNKDCWHITIISCALCQNVVRTVDDWKNFDADLVSRSYWMCNLLEGGFMSELRLSPTGIAELENDVPLPLFLSNSIPEKSNSDEDLFVEYHFLAQITLRALINHIHTSLCFYPNPYQSGALIDFPPRTSILELDRQLYAWRENLPRALNWNDQDPDIGVERPITPGSRQQMVLGERASPLQSDAKILLNASLRTRYKYAQYLIWRSYVYKMLQFPDLCIEEDVQGCREAFKACSMWPLTYPVFFNQRRLIPHIYEYSHTLFGILVLLHACSRGQVLAGFLETPEEHDNLELSKGYMLQWMRDMQVIHPVARWCWQLLKVIYREHPAVKDLLS